VKICSVESREWVALVRGVDADVMGRRTQKTAHTNCPFCGALAKIYLWSLYGSGKLCTCGAKFSSGGQCSRVVDSGVDVRETKFSKPGRPEFEVFAPDGYNFSGPHSLIVRDSITVASDEARAASLVKCQSGCGCGWDET
jgi:hypothetical protein